MTTSLPRALVVEDDADIHSFLNTVLADTVELTFAGDIAAATKLLGSEPFAMILLDIHLPDGSGVDLLKAVRESPELGRSQKLPVVMMTTSDSGEHYEDTLWLGSIAYVKKPLDISTLTSAIGQALASRAASPA